MAQNSRFWNGTTVGDAASPEAPYNADTEFAQVMLAMAGALADPNRGGVFFGNSEGILTVTGGTSPLSMAAGQAIVYGNWYHNDSVATLVIPTPSGATRKDLVTLRKDWTLQTVRLTRVAGVEGGAVASPIQVVGTIWDYPMYEADITTGGVVTLTDLRTYLAGQAQYVLVSQQFHQEQVDVNSSLGSNQYVSLPAGFSIIASTAEGDRVIIRANGNVGGSAGVAQTTSAGWALDKDGSKLLNSTTAPETYMSGAISIITGVAFTYTDDAVAAGSHTYTLQGVIKVNGSGNSVQFGHNSLISMTVEVWRPVT